MKIFILVITCLVFIIVKISKNDLSGLIVYGYQRNYIPKEEKEKAKELYNLLDQMNKSAKDLNFELMFNSNESIFKLENQMENDLDPLSISYAKNMISKGMCYYNIEEDMILRQTDIYGDKTLIKSSPKKFKWKLFKENKQIGSYLCYKATTIVSKQSIGKSKTFIIEAWYCPEIPLPYGPNGYNGLPGIILELKDSNYTYFAKTLKIEPNKNYKIEPPKSDKIISEIEHEGNLIKRYGN